MYDPLVGRFLGDDPLGAAAGDPNLYRYAANAPTNATDPSGYAPVTGTDHAAGGAALGPLDHLGGTHLGSLMPPEFGAGPPPADGAATGALLAEVEATLTDLALGRIDDLLPFDRLDQQWLSHLIVSPAAPAVDYPAGDPPAAAPPDDPFRVQELLQLAGRLTDRPSVPSAIELYFGAPLPPLGGQLPPTLPPGPHRIPSLDPHSISMASLLTGHSEAYIFRQRLAELEDMFPYLKPPAGPAGPVTLSGGPDQPLRPGMVLEWDHQTERFHVIADPGPGPPGVADIAGGRTPAQMRHDADGSLEMMAFFAGLWAQNQVAMQRAEPLKPLLNLADSLWLPNAFARTGFGIMALVHGWGRDRDGTLSAGAAQQLWGDLMAGPQAIVMLWAIGVAGAAGRPTPLRPGDVVPAAPGAPKPPVRPAVPPKPVPSEPDPLVQPGGVRSSPNGRGPQQGTLERVTIDKYKNEMLDGSLYTNNLNKIDAFFDGSNLVVRDGHHRVQVALELYRETGNAYYLNELIRFSGRSYQVPSGIPGVAPSTLPGSLQYGSPPRGWIDGPFPPVGSP